MKQQTPNIVTVLGSKHYAIDIVFGKVFKYNTCPGTILVLDYMGRGAIYLSETNKMSIYQKNIFWFDAADRRHTIQLLKINNSAHANKILERVMHLLCSSAGIKIKDSTLGWFIKTAINFSRSGAITLSVLLRLLIVPEIKRLYFNSDIDQEEIIALQKLLVWALKYPSIYAVSEGVHQVSLENYFSEKSVVWVECLSEHLEKTEHSILSGIIDITAENAIKNYFTKAPNSKLDLTVIHIFPPQNPFPELPDWIKENQKNIKHVCLLSFSPDKTINKIGHGWVKESENIWITGGIGNIRRNMHNNWLTEIEMKQIENMDLGKVWVKSNYTGKAIIANVRTSEDSFNLSHKLRVEAYKKMKTTSVQQMSTEIDVLSPVKQGIVGLYRKLFDKEYLRQGWNRVKEGKKDSHGIDKVTIRNYGNNIESELDELQNELKNKKYQCRPIRRIYFEKPEGGTREIGVACVRDRVVQTSCLMLIEPLFEPDFSNYSFAYRPRRNAHQAISLIKSRIKTGYEWAVIADIKKCFDSIDHNVLIEFVERKCADADIINLIKHWLYVEVLEFNELLPSILGVPQGESLSPLLSNIYLDSLDKHFENLGYSFVRFADDIIIQINTEQEAEKALYILQSFLAEPLHLQIKPEKTNYVSIDEGFEYLGFRITRNSIAIRNRKIKLVFETMEKYMRILGDKSSTIDNIITTMMKINASVRGFRNYFMLPEEQIIKNQLELLDGQIESLAASLLPVEFKDDPAWICRERFYVPTNIDDIENDEEEMLRRTKTENEYPQENIYYNVPRDLIKDGYNEKTSVIIEDNDNSEQNTEKTIRDTVFAIDKRLYVMTHGSYLTNDDNCLIVKKNKKEIAKYRFEDLGLIYLQGKGINISVDLQIRLAELDIPIVFAPGTGTPIAVLNTIFSNKSQLRKLQVIRRDDADIVSTGLNMLNAKVLNQTALLKYFYKYKKRREPSTFIQIKKDINSMCELALKFSDINPESKDVRAIAMGYEGHAASIYWQNIKKLLPADFEFTGRITRYAKDVINQCFNYVYGILYGEVWRAVIKMGLDPYFGIIHGSQRDSGSLIFDIIEEFRSPFADKIVIGMLGRGYNPEINKDGLLKTNSKKLLARSFSKRWNSKIKWRSFNLSPAQILEHQTNSLSKLFKNEGKYLPYRMKW